MTRLEAGRRAAAGGGWEAACRRVLCGAYVELDARGVDVGAARGQESAASGACAVPPSPFADG